MAGGLDAETAFNLSDLYIRRIDRCTAPEQIHALHRELVEAYADRMLALRNRPAFSRPILRCVEHIHTHLHGPIPVDELCGVSQLSRAHLSRLFRREVGMTITQYITAKRLEAAAELLEFTDQPVSGVANVLSFSSQSHFISVFRRHFGMTPGEYRRRAQSAPSSI